MQTGGSASLSLFPTGEIAELQVVDHRLVLRIRHILGATERELEAGDLLHEIDLRIERLLLCVPVAALYAGAACAQASLALKGGGTALVVSAAHVHLADAVLRIVIALEDRELEEAHPDLDDRLGRDRDPLLFGQADHLLRVVLAEDVHVDLGLESETQELPTLLGAARHGLPGYRICHTGEDAELRPRQITLLSWFGLLSAVELLGCERHDDLAFAREPKRTLKVSEGAVPELRGNAGDGVELGIAQLHQIVDGGPVDPGLEDRHVWNAVLVEIATAGRDLAGGLGGGACAEREGHYDRESLDDQCLVFHRYSNPISALRFTWMSFRKSDSGPMPKGVSTSRFTWTESKSP
jgi:hypothetical protein